MGRVFGVIAVLRGWSQKNRLTRFLLFVGFIWVLGGIATQILKRKEDQTSEKIKAKHQKFWLYFETNQKRATRGAARDHQ